ncbi:MAG TPA: phosphotransferase [Candidatus Limnocylindria bacterium]|nr:phosphotransferase [Candidatus Limnocylindria bacterium]
MDELVLIGGNLSAAVRVGDTVRRRAGPWTPAVHGLLEHLHRAGFGAAPEPVGMDDQGRAVLRFVPGDVHSGWPEPMPEWMFTDETTLIGAAKLLRRYHDVVVTFTPPSDTRWRIVAPEPREVICHFDWAPYNAVFDGHRPTAMLDWDNAGPGSRLWDVALSAGAWVPLDLKTSARIGPEGLLARRGSRLATFCGAYGGVDPSGVLDTLVAELPFMAEFIQREADAGDPGFARLTGWDVPARLRREAALLQEQKQLLLRNT